MKKLNSKLPYKQLRFYCKGKNIFHIQTLDTDIGNLVANFILGDESKAKSCGSFEIYDDDSSYLSRHCNEWGYTEGHWGFSHYTHFYKQTIKIAGKAEWNAGGGGKLICEELSEKQDTYMSLYVR